MAALRELTRLIRSKNAGPFELTFDIMFSNATIYHQVKDSGAINPRLFADLYGVPEQRVRVVAYEPALAYKVTIPRAQVSGSIGDNDVYGAQQFGPLVEIELPISSPGCP
jgi:hypothetical protein